jgi:copper transport protein
VLVSSNPPAGGGLASPPTAITLTFSEEPEPSLATIRLTGPTGAPIEIEPPVRLPSDARSLSARVPELARGIYAVEWRVVSRVDGHPTAGSFSFGVGTTPEQAEITRSSELTETPSTSPMEIAARFLLLAGVVALLGATCAGAANFAGPDRGVRLAAAAWVASVIGLGLLTVAQHASTAVGFGDFLDTYAGRAALGRSIGLGIIGLALLDARRASETFARVALACAALTAAALIGVHVAAGHAAVSSGLTQWATVAGQWAHFVAAGVWIGGLAALLLGTRGAPTRDKAAAVRRFSAAAAVALAVVVATGVARGAVALGSWDDLVSTAYGRVVLAKVLLVVGIGLLAWRNRRRSVPVAEASLGPLRRVSTAELGLAVLAIGAAALLGSLSPPVEVDRLGLSVEGRDPTGSVDARLETEWAVAGPNRFELHLEDDRTGDPLDADRVTLRFVAPDDPGVPASTLPLERSDDARTWVGAGGNLEFPGRWLVSAVAERAARSRVVPLELEIEGPPLFLSVDAFPGQPRRYSVQLSDNSFIRFTVDPVRKARQQVTVEFFHFFGEPRPVEQVVVTAARPDNRTRQLPLRRRSPSSFDGRVALDAGATRFAVIGRTPEGVRLYGEYDLDVVNEQ